VASVSTAGMEEKGMLKSQSSGRYDAVGSVAVA